MGVCLLLFSFLFGCSVCLLVCLVCFVNSVVIMWLFIVLRGLIVIYLCFLNGCLF